MTDNQFIQLERLLGKLAVHLDHTYCIIPNYLGDGCYIAIYDDAGNIKKQATYMDVKSTAEKILTKPEN